MIMGDFGLKYLKTATTMVWVGRSQVSCFTCPCIIFSSISKARRSFIYSIVFMRLSMQSQPDQKGKGCFYRGYIQCLAGVVYPCQFPNSVCQLSDFFFFRDGDSEFPKALP
jgi:hypothetical protein